MSCKCNFKQPTKEDLKKIDRYNWKITIGKEHKPLQLCDIDGCLHTKGGKYGYNEYYAYDIDIPKEEVTLDDLNEFNGEVCWGYNVEQRNYYRKGRIEIGTFCTITCAGEQVYEFSCGWNLMPHKIMMTIEALKELPTINPITHRGFEDELIGKKVYFKDKPGIITHYFKKYGEIIIKADKESEDFGKACWMSDEDYSNMVQDEGYEVKVDILSKDIWWFRD